MASTAVNVFDLQRIFKPLKNFKSKSTLQSHGSYSVTRLYLRNFVFERRVAKRSFDHSSLLSKMYLSPQPCWTSRNDLWILHFFGFHSHRSIFNTPYYTRSHKSIRIPGEWFQKVIPLLTRLLSICSITILISSNIIPL